MGFPLTLRSMDDHDDLELLSGQIILEFSRVSEAITAKQMKIDPYCQRRNCSQPTKCTQPHRRQA